MQSFIFKKLKTPIMLSIMSMFLGLQSSCSLLPSLTPEQPSASNQFEKSEASPLSAKETSDEYVEAMKKKVLYEGPIQVDIVPGLDAQFQSVWHLMIPGSEFSIQALPQGPLIFQKNLFKGKELLEETLPFQVHDTLQRYTLHVQIQGDLQAQVSVNINGTDWIRPADFKGREAQINTLLLNKSNLLRVRAVGKQGSSVLVSVVQAGEAGTVLKRRGYLRHPNQTQASHISQNDTNIFDPRAPDSLGGLVPYQGETKDSSGFYHGMMRVNQEELPLEFQNGILIFQRDPALSQKWAEIQSLYDLEILEESENRSLVRLNLDKAPLENLVNLLAEYGQRVPQPLTHLKFSSLQALQTFSIFLDLYFNHSDAFERMEFNGYAQMLQATPSPCSSPMPQDWENPDPNLGKSWWLVDTRTASPVWDPVQFPSRYRTGAWDYSLGTGVKVAIIDKGFDTTHQEIIRRVRKGPRYQNEAGIDDDNDIPCVAGYLCPNHGHDATLVGFAEKDNKLGTAGSAPNAEIIPLRRNHDYWSIERALKIAITNKIDIVSMSFSGDDLRKEWWALGGFFAGQGMMDQITNATQKGIIVFVAAGNNPNKKSHNLIPANHPDAIPVGGLVIEPTSTRVINSCSQLPIIPNPTDPLKTGTLKNVYSSGSNLVYGPGRYILVQKRWNNVPNTALDSKEGTSTATPFVAGIAALIKSRRPDITPAEMKNILLNAKGLKDDKGSLHLIDAELALKNALGANFPKASWYFALVEPDSTLGPNGHKLRLNKTVQTNASASEKEKKLPSQTISDQAWRRLQNGTLVKVRGWTGVPANASNQVFVGQDSDISASPVKIRLNENQLELSEVESICPANNCSNPGSFNPQLAKVTYSANPVEANGFELELEGQNLVADIRTGTNIVPIKLVFKHVKSTATTPVTPLPGDKVVDISANQILDIRNDGTYVKLKANLGEISKDFEYQIAFRSGITGLGTFASNYVRAGGTTSAVFSIKAEGGSSNTFSPEAILSPPTGAEPAAFGVKAFYNPQNTNPISVRAGDVIGFFTANARTRNISIEIQGKNAVVTAAHDDLFTVTVPADLVVGLAHFTFKSDDTVFTIENLINYTSPFPEVVKFSKPTIFANGGDVVDAYITVKNPNGQPAPDGTPYYVQLVPTQLGLYPDLTMIHPETGQQYGGRGTTVEQVLPVKNGKIHIQAKLNAPIAPYEYTYDFNNNLPNVFTWPHANAPSFQVQVCNPAYDSGRPGYGYYCGQQLFPQAGNTLDGRLYALHAYSFDPQIHHVISGTPKRTVTLRNIKDILGNPIPVGTVLHFNQTYYGNVSNPNGNDIYWGVAVTTPGEVDIVYEPFQRLYCDLVGIEEGIYMTSVQGAANNSLYWLVGNPIYFRYVTC